MATIESNRYWAQQALEFVKSKGIKPANKGPLSKLYAMSHGLSGDFVSEQRHEAVGSGVGQVNAALESGLGNCGEMSWIAYYYLQTIHAANIAVVTIQNGNHTFAVVGLPKPSWWQNKQGITVRSNQPPEDWGQDAVVCDPWATVGRGPWDMLGRVGVWDVATQWTLQIANVVKEARSDGVIPPKLQLTYDAFDAGSGHTGL